MNSKKIFKVIKDEKDTLKGRYKVSKIGLFGSFAGGSQSRGSDIDLLVDFSAPVGFEFLELKEYLEGKFKRKVDLVTRAALKPAIKQRVLKEVRYS